MLVIFDIIGEYIGEEQQDHQSYSLHPRSVSSPAEGKEPHVS